MSQIYWLPKPISIYIMKCYDKLFYTWKLQEMQNSLYTPPRLLLHTEGPWACSTHVQERCCRTQVCGREMYIWVHIRAKAMHHRLTTSFFGCSVKRALECISHSRPLWSTPQMIHVSKLYTIAVPLSKLSVQRSETFIVHSQMNVTPHPLFDKKTPHANTGKISIPGHCSAVSDLQLQCHSILNATSAAILVVANT